jgi:hypothetical protein
VGDLAVLGNGSDRGQVVVNSGSDGATELGLLGGVLLAEDGGVDIVPGTIGEKGRRVEAACEKSRRRRR